MSAGVSLNTMDNIEKITSQMKFNIYNIFMSLYRQRLFFAETIVSFNSGKVKTKTRISVMITIKTLSETEMQKYNRIIIL